MNSEKNLRVAILLDYYAPMLTDKQKDVIDLYYNEDLSLSEIAEHESITRQGVRDSIKRGEQTLFDMEEKFHLAERSEKFSELMERILAIAKDIKSECSYSGNVKMASRLVDTLLRLAEENRELF